MTSSAPTAVTRPSFPPQVVSQVVSGWLAAESAFVDAARTSVRTRRNWLHHYRSAVDSVSFPIGTDETSGDVAGGPVDYGSPRVIALLGIGRSSGLPRDSEVVISMASGQAAPGVLGQVDFELFTSRMRKTEGGWKLLTQVVGVGRCDRL